MQKHESSASCSSRPVQKQGSTSRWDNLASCSTQCTCAVVSCCVDHSLIRCSWFIAGTLQEDCCCIAWYGFFVNTETRRSCRCQSCIKYSTGQNCWSSKCCIQLSVLTTCVQHCLACFVQLTGPDRRIMSASCPWFVLQLCKCCSQTIFRHNRKTTIRRLLSPF